jgi:hypothetical protein
MRFRLSSLALLFMLLAAPAAAQVKVTPLAQTAAPAAAQQRPAPAAAQVKVTTLAQRGTPLKESNAVRLSRFADLTETKTLKVGDVLSEGDRLTALASDLFVELTCPKGTLMRFTGSFQVEINPPGEADCALNDLSGDLDVVTDQPTKVDAGGKTLGTSGTRYAVSRESRTEAPSEQVLVFEGKVEVKTPTGSTLISTGQTVTFTRLMTKLEPRPVTENEIQRRAGLYAQFDVVKARASGVEVTDTQAAETEVKLTKLHAAVLRNPAAAQPRLALAREQASNRIGDEALYNFRRSNTIDPTKLQAIRPDGIKRGDEIEYKRLDQLLRESVPKEIPLIDKGKRSVVVQPTKSFSTAIAIGSMAAGKPAAPPSDDELAKWLAAGRLADVVSALETKLASSSLSSREELLLAKGYAGAGDRERAAKAAVQALQRSQADGLLNADEIALCRRLSVKKN